MSARGKVRPCLARLAGAWRACAVLALLGALLLPTGDRQAYAAADAEAARACLAVAETNLLVPQGGWLRPSPAYADGNWLRDAFWTTSALGRRVGRVALDNFGRQLSPAGQAPTKLRVDGSGGAYDDDESTLLYIIWAYRDGGQPPGRLLRAWGWLRGHVTAGGYVTPPGNFHTWHDTLLFPQEGVAAYNQGLYVVAALAAVRLGLADEARAEAAAVFYRQLYRRDYGYMPVSLKLDYHDASALVGEVLARSLFDQAILSDEAVLNTVNSLPRAGDGFKVLTAGDGTYLPPTAFSPIFARGDYQNGGSWLLYDVLAWLAAAKAGSPKAEDLARQRLAEEAASGDLYEYTTTLPPGGPFRSVHPTYGWNAYACIALGLDGIPDASQVRRWAAWPTMY